MAGMIKGKKGISEIPLQLLPEGIRISFANSIRHTADADLLASNKRYQTATVSLLVAVEELAKTLLLLQHFKKKENVPLAKAQQYFSDHEYRLSEFMNYTHSLLPSLDESAQEMFTRLNSFAGKQQQAYKEKLMYVDFKNGRWFTPSHIDQLGIDSEDDISVFMKANFDRVRIDLAMVQLATQKNPDFQAVINSPTVEIPNNLSVITLVKSLLPPKTPIKVKTTETKVFVNIDPLNGRITEQLRQSIKDALKVRFSAHLFIVSLSTADL